MGLPELLWKTVTPVINSHLKQAIDFDLAQHGFFPRESTSAAIVDVRMLAELASLQRKVWCHVFLDFSKACDALDRARLLDLLRACGIGPNIVRILEMFWATHAAHPRQAGCHGTPVAVNRGVTQGEVVSPTLFNIVINAIIRHWRHQFVTRLTTPTPSNHQQIFTPMTATSVAPTRLLSNSPSTSSLTCSHKQASR